MRNLTESQREMIAVLPEGHGDRVVISNRRCAGEIVREGSRPVEEPRPNLNHRRVARPGDREFDGALEAKAARRPAAGALRLRATKAQNPGAFSI
jgi:hypothetical protein